MVKERIRETGNHIKNLFAIDLFESNAYKDYSSHTLSCYDGVQKGYFMKIIITIILFTILGCSKVADVRKAQILGAKDVSQFATKPIALTKIAAKIRRGTEIGNLYYTVYCHVPIKFTWKSSRTHFYDLDDLESVFIDELEGNGYTVVGSDENLFEGRDVSGAELLVAARVLKVKVDMCSPTVPPNEKIHGSLFIEVEWQLYDPFKKEVTAIIKTQGSHKIEETVSDGYMLLWDNAFAVATNNLLANKKFIQLSVSKKKRLN